MEKREPSLVPEWLRSSGNGSGVGCSNNHLVSSSSSRSDSSSLSHNSKNRDLRSRSDGYAVRSHSLDRSYSTNAGRGFSNGSTKQTYTNFNVTRANRYRASYMDQWDDDTCPPFGNLSIGRDQEQQLRRSQSMTSRNQGPTIGFRNGRNINSYKGTGFTWVKKSGFEKDSPSWTSALAENPNVTEKKTGVESMAEALVKAPSRTFTPSQDRVIQQSRQLIPIVPSAPRSTADKSKARPVGYTHQSSASQVKPDASKKLVILKPSASQVNGAPSTNGPRELMVAGNKLMPAQTQSRNAFYRALKEKTSTTDISTDPFEASSSIFSPLEEKAYGIKEDTDPSSIQTGVEKASEVVEMSNGFELTDRPDEKEAEFLRSLGWEENNSEEEEALTQEEINAFKEKYMKSEPSLVLKLPIIQEARGDVIPNS